MAKTVALIASLDTKGVEAGFIAQILRERGHRPLVIDVGVMAEPSSPAPDIRAAEVAQAGDGDLDALRQRGDKAGAMEVMTRGAAAVAARLYAEQRFDGIIGLGGTAGTAIASSASVVVARTDGSFGLFAVLMGFLSRRSARSAGYGR